MSKPLVMKSVEASFLLLAVSFSGGTWAAISAHTEPYISYTVRAGDSLQALSKQLLADPRRWNELARRNGLKNPNLIQPGYIIDVPRSLINFDLQPKLANQGAVKSVNGKVTINGVPADVGTAVPEGARVQTNAGSSAVIQLSDGSRVQLMPNSLAEVVKQHGYAMKDPANSSSTTWFSGALRLIVGTLDISANKSANRKDALNVVTPTSLIGVRGTQFRVAFEDPSAGTARTEVLEGKVRADNPSQGAGADVGGGFGVAIKPNERDIKVVALLPALPESGLPQRVERAREGASADWHVGTLGGAAAYRAELAQDAGFTQIVFGTKSASPAINLAAAPNGQYFARVRGVDRSGIEGYNAMQRIDISNAPAVVVWIREINIAATAEFLAEGVLLRLNTSAADTPSAIELQIAPDAGMLQGMQRLPLNATGQVLLKDLKAGERRYLRFSGATPGGVNASSPVLLIELPLDWGSTVLSLSSALQTLP